MTGEIRWVALLPDPATGLDAPVCEAGSRKPKVFVAADKASAERQVPGIAEAQESGEIRQAQGPVG